VDQQGTRRLFCIEADSPQRLLAIAASVASRSNSFAKKVLTVAFFNDFATEFAMFCQRTSEECHASSHWVKSQTAYAIVSA